MSLSEIRSHELVRKAIHLSSAAIPLLYWFVLERHHVLEGVIVLAFLFLSAEYFRLHSETSRRLFMRVFGSALRSHEHENLTGATYVFVGAVLCIFLFPKEIAVVSLLILSVSDTCAALIGIPFGRHKFLSKSVEGSTTFFVVTMIILQLFLPASLLLNILVAAALTVAEAYPMDLDDNFVIPILSGILLSLISFI
jgi:dolichol kinase